MSRSNSQLRLETPTPTGDFGFEQYERHTPGASGRNPFETPPFATPIPSIRSRGPRSIVSTVQPERPTRRFKSSRLTGQVEKPWLKERRVNWDSIIFYAAVVAALGVVGFLCWNEVRQVPKHDYCLVMDDKFANLDNWSHEIQMNGFGTGSFDWTTDDAANSYVDSQGLHIVPTITTQSTDITVEQLVDGHTVNLTSDGTCTTRDQRMSTLSTSNPCWAVSNSTNGTIINPVRSARLTTIGKKTIKYGRVEVVAKMPAGDWLWPAIWMMPQDSVYGEWPKSGEIDIAESRGNDARKYPIGNNIVSSALHWGSSYATDSWKLSYGEWGAKRTKYSDAFHTYGLEWSEKYLFTWLDGRLRQIVYVDFTKHKNLWEYGEFAYKTVNGTAPTDTWTQTGRSNTPFDQPFYLILNVAVGSTNGWFPDDVGSKPWSDQRKTPMKDFWASNSTWLPTWGTADQRGMTVKSVKMWQEGKCSS